MVEKDMLLKYAINTFSRCDNFILILLFMHVKWLKIQKALLKGHKYHALKCQVNSASTECIWQEW